MTTRARSNKSFILCLYMKIIRVNQVKGHFVPFLQPDRRGIIAKHLIYRKVLFSSDACSTRRRSFLHSLSLQCPRSLS